MKRSRTDLPVSADIGTHERVVEIFSKFERGRVLDAPAGSGALTQALLELGFAVVSADLEAAPTLRAVAQHILVADFNRSLPLPEASFDSIACIEGIEHLENPLHWVRECARLLRPGGRLVLTTPNILVISSRFRFLLTGFFNKFPRPLDETRHEPRDHINPIAYPELRFILRRAGFTIEQITTNRVKAKEWLGALLLPLLYPLTKLTLSVEQTATTRAMNRAIFRELMSRPLLFGQALIVVGRKAS